MTKTWTVEEVRALFTGTVVNTFAATDDGQKHLNRIAKAITNESIDQRLVAQRKTHAKKAFDKKVSEVAITNPEKVQDLYARKEAWLVSWIDRKYGTEEVD
jgi:DNA-binding PadR family transcriptional regulator